MSRLVVVFLAFLMVQGVSLAALPAGPAGAPEPHPLATQYISVNTTWGISGSPYNLTEPVVVEDGAVLTIEAGDAPCRPEP